MEHKGRAVHSGTLLEEQEREEQEREGGGGEAECELNW